jgi:hypothetical protein
LVDFFLGFSRASARARTPPPPFPATPHNTTLKGVIVQAPKSSPFQKTGIEMAAAKTPIILFD